MPSATVTAKGQITLPKPIRESLGVSPGDTVVFRVDEHGNVVVRAEKARLSSLRGALEPRVRGVTLADMDRAIAGGAASE